MVESRVPRRLWEYGLIIEAGILSRVARGHDGRPGLERLTGDLINIFKWLDSGFYDLVWYHDQPKADMAEEPRKLGRWMGIAHRVGSNMCYWIATVLGKVVARTTVQHVTQDDVVQPEMENWVKESDKLPRERLDDSNFVDNQSNGPGFLEDLVFPEEENNQIGMIPTDKEYGDMVTKKRQDADNMVVYNKYVGAQIQIDIRGEHLAGTVTKRMKGLDGNPIGQAHNNPIFDKRVYKVSFPGRAIHKYTANVIAENLYAQVNSEGRSFAILEESIGHRKGIDAVNCEDGSVMWYNVRSG